MCSVDGVLSTPYVDFLEFFPGKRNHHHFSDDVAKSATAKLKMKMKMKMLPAGFSVALCNTAIQSCDRHGHRSLLLLGIADFVVDAVDVVDSSVSESVPSPPGEHLAFFRHC